MAQSTRKGSEEKLALLLPICGTLLAGCGNLQNVTVDASDNRYRSSVRPATTSTSSARTTTTSMNDAGTDTDQSDPSTNSSSETTHETANLVWHKANLTNFTSYPDPGSEECIKYNGCMWAGQFAALSGKQSLDWVMSHNIASVHMKDFERYKLKTLRLRKGSKQIDVTVYDECADSDCSGCCTENSRETGYLIDIESFTANRFGVDDGIVDWACIDCD